MNDYGLLTPLFFLTPLVHELQFQARPEDGYLRFHLEYNQHCKASFRMKNIADQDILFKVKTTLPSTYFVDPNQDCMKAGQELTVNVIMMNEECRKFIENYKRGSKEAVHKHMFKVEAVPITPTEYTDLKALEPANRSATYNRLLGNTEATKKSTSKFKVAFTYPAVQGLHRCWVL